MNIEALLPYIVSGVTAVAGWMVGRRKQKNDFLNDQQSSINLLSDENKKLLEEIVKLRTENASLRSEVAELRNDINDLKLMVCKNVPTKKEAK